MRYETGAETIDPAASISRRLVTEGVLGTVTPGREQSGDVEFAWPLLRQIVELDVGNAMAVRERDVIAVQATEDIASLIERAGRLCRAKGWTLLWTAAPGQDEPGLPEVDADTVQRLAGARGRCLALGAGRAVLVEPTAVLETADRARIAVLGIAG